MALGLVTVKQEREISSSYEVQACVVSFAIDQLRSTAMAGEGTVEKPGNSTDIRYQRILGPFDATTPAASSQGHFLLSFIHSFIHSSRAIYDH